MSVRRWPWSTEFWNFHRIPTASIIANQVTMRTVDEILRDHNAGITLAGAENCAPVERFSRKRNIETVRRLSQIDGWKTTGFLLFHWALILGSLAVAGWSMHWLAFAVGTIVIASRLQALGVMMHDASHYMLYRNRTINDVVSDLFISFPIGLSTTLYRKTHFRHHRFTNSEEDQDLAAQIQEREWYEWPKTRWGCAAAILRSLFGFNFYKGWILFKHWAPWKHLFDPIDSDFPLRARLLYVGSIACVYAFFAWAIMQSAVVTFSLMAMYMLSGATVLNLVNRLRATAEHLGTEQTHELNSTRTVIPTLWERWLIAPYGVSYHLEHHLYPSVPGYNLAELHRELMKDQEYASRAHITHSYVGLIRELMQPRPATAPRTATA
jgi:fatty acid desaturase